MIGEQAQTIGILGMLILMAWKEIISLIRDRKNNGSNDIWNLHQVIDSIGKLALNIEKQTDTLSQLATEIKVQQTVISNLEDRISKTN